MSKYVVGAAAAEEFAPAEDNDEEEEDEQEDLGKNIAQAGNYSGGFSVAEMIFGFCAACSTEPASFELAQYLRPCECTAFFNRDHPHTRYFTVQSPRHAHAVQASKLSTRLVAAYNRTPPTWDSNPAYL